MSWRNFTAFVYFRPRRHIVEDPTFANIDIDEFSHQFTYTPDRLEGFADFASDPWATRETAEGDCEDYALFIASCLRSRGVDNVGLGFCYNTWPLRGHVVAFDDNRVYSSGRIFSMSFESYGEHWDITSRRMID